MSVAAPEKVTPLQNFFQKTSPLYLGYIQKRYQMCPSLSTFLKKTLSTDAIAKSPRKGHTPFRNFFKKSVTRYTNDYRIFFAFCFCTLEKSSRTGIFTIASIVINNARQRLVQRNEPQHTRWQISLRIKLRPEKQEKVCRFYYKKYSKRLILRLTLSFRLIYYKQNLYLPTNTMAKKWKHHIKNFGNF